MSHFFLTLIGRVAHAYHDSSGSTCDVASIHSGPTIRRTNILVNIAPIFVLVELFIIIYGMPKMSNLANMTEFTATEQIK